MPMITQTRKPAARTGEVEEFHAQPADSGRTTRIVCQGLLGVIAGASFVVAGPLTPHPVVALLLGVCLIAGSIVLAVRADRAGRRRDLLSGAAEALAPLVGTSKRGKVRLTANRWTGGWVGYPTRVRVGYSGRASSHDPAWAQEITELCARRMDSGVEYRVSHHDTRGRMLHLVAAEPDPEPEVEPVPEVQQRATEYLTQVMGPTTRVESVEWSEDGSELRALEVSHSAGAKLAAPGYRRRVEGVVNNTLPNRWRAQWDLERDRARFEVRPTFPEEVWMPAHPVDEVGMDVSSYRQVQIPFGVDEDGQEVVWRPARDPHMMLVGASGTGKTVTAHGLLAQITRRGWPVWILDGKAIEFLGFRDWPNVQIVATRVEEQVALLHRAHQLMEHRYDLIVQGKATEADFEPLFLLIDEWADFRGNVLSWYSQIKIKGDPTKPRCLELAGSIARKGRSARVHLLFGTQRPDAEYFGGDMRDNFRMRISMGRLSPQGAQMMWENPAIGVSIPQACKGRATTVNDANRPLEIQTYRTPNPRTDDSPEELELLTRLRPGRVRHERLVYLPPAPLTDLDGKDDGEPIPPSYSDYVAAGWGRAVDHPELDPLSDANQVHRVAADASPMSVFGLPRPDAPVPTSSTPTRPQAEAVEPVVEEDSWSTAGELEGYGEIEEVGVGEVEPGWMLLVDPDGEQWGVVESPPEPDPFDEELLSVSWRGDRDECGTLTADEPTVLVRRPLEVQ